MLDDGSKSLGGSQPLEVVDLALLLERSLGTDVRPGRVEVVNYGREDPAAGGDA